MRCYNKTTRLLNNMMGARFLRTWMAEVRSLVLVGPKIIEIQSR